MFVTKRYIYNDKKTKNEIEINSVRLNPFLVDFIDNPKKYYKDAIFFDYDFSFLGEFLYFDESIINVNGDIFEHNLLVPEKRKEIFDDLEPLKKLFDKYLKKEMVVISFEDLNSLNIKTITPFSAIKIKSKFDEIFIKNRDNWIKIEELNNKFVYAKSLTLKIDEIQQFDGVDGICKFDFHKNKRFLSINLYNKTLKIDLLNLIRVENETK